MAAFMHCCFVTKGSRLRKKMSLRTFVLVGGALCAAVVGGPVAAQQALDGIAIDGVAMMDPETVLQQPQTRTFDLSFNNEATRRLAPDATTAASPLQQDGETRQVELQFAATGDRAGVPLDVAVAQRASLRANDDGNIDGRGGGSELRIGRNLVQQDGDRQRQGSSFYVFVADDDDALTWAPRGGSGPDARGTGLALEDRVDVGDMSAGVTYERNGVQASLAYVEREVKTSVGRESFSQDESFTGLTVTMRR